MSNGCTLILASTYDFDFFPAAHSELLRTYATPCRTCRIQLVCRTHQTTQSSHMLSQLKPWTPPTGRNSGALSGMVRGKSHGSKEDALPRANNRGSSAIIETVLTKNYWSSNSNIEPPAREAALRLIYFVPNPMSTSQGAQVIMA